MAYSLSDYLTETYGPNQNLGTLAGRINQINRNMQQQANRARIPGAAGLEAQSSDMIRSQLAGMLPTDVMGLLGQQAAERGVARGAGMVGAPATSAAYLRALGLTSREQQESGQRNLTAAYARNPGAPLWSPGDVLMTQAQSGQLNLEQARLAQQAQQERERLKLERDRMQLEAQLAALRSAGGGGGGRYAGGGGAVPEYASAGTAPTWGDLFQTRGTVSSDESWAPFSGYPTSTPTPIPTPETEYDFYTGEFVPAQAPLQPYEGWGYQPVSSGEMYIGSLEGYQG